MNKKFLSAMLFGAFTIAATSTFVSCKDYDDDINNLQAQITSNAQKIADLQKWYDAGNVITKVEKADDGRGIKVTLSDNNVYVIEGGKDGAKGEKGDTGAQGLQGPDGKSAYEIWLAAGNTGSEADFLASLVGPKGEDGSLIGESNVWTIGSDGYWYLNDNKTDYKAVATDGEAGAAGIQGPKGDKGDKGDQGEKGEKGDKGDKGDTGATGAQGDKGDKGDYYYPADDTFWYLVNGQTGERTKTEYSWVGQGMTAAQTGDVVYFKNIPGGQDFAISTKLSLASLVAKPGFYYHGIEAFDLAEINYWAKEYKMPPVTSENEPDLNSNWFIRGKKQTINKYIDFKMTAGSQPERKDYYADYEEKVNNDTMEMIPDFVATYHLNPSNASISLDPSRYSFIIENKEYTRAVDRSNILQLNNIWKVEKANTSNQINGMNGAGSAPYDHIYSSNKSAVKSGAINVYANFRTNLEWTRKHTELIQKIAEEDAVTVIALQYKKDKNWGANTSDIADSVITSDYAALYAARYYNLRLNLIQKNWGYDYHDHRHLHTKAAEAIESKWYEDFAIGYDIDGSDAHIPDPTLVNKARTYRDTTRIVNITWNNPGIDLDSIVNTHFDYWHRSTAYNDRAWDRCAADGTPVPGNNLNGGTLYNKGLVYSYELIGWFKDGNKTSESVHASLKDWYVDANGNKQIELRPHILRPQLPKYVDAQRTNYQYGPDSDGEYDRFEAQPQNLSTVGREPLVRVTLTDTINNKKVKIGYIKFHIVKTDIPDEIVQAKYEFKQPFVMVCGEPEIRLDLTWSQIESQILNVMKMKNPDFPGITKQEFEKNYKLVTNSYAPLNASGSAAKGQAPANYEWLPAAQYIVNNDKPTVKDKEIRKTYSHYPNPTDDTKYNDNEVNKTYFGEVYYGTDLGETINNIDPAVGQSTTVLTWRISYNQAYQWFAHNSINGANNTSRTIYVRFQKVGHDQMYATGEDRMRAIEQAEEWISIKLTWTPDRYVGPLGGTVAQNRNSNYWYKHNEITSRKIDGFTDQGNDFDDIHVHVQTLGQRDMYDADGKTTCRFESDILSTLIGNNFEKVSGWDAYDEYNDETKNPLKSAPYNTTYTGIYSWLNDDKNHVNPWEQKIPANWQSVKAWPRYREDINGTDKLFDEIHIWDKSQNQAANAVTADKIDEQHRGQIAVAHPLTKNLVNRFDMPIDNKATPKFPAGISLVFDITTPKVDKVENLQEWGKSINDPIFNGANNVLMTNIRGAHPRSNYTIYVGDNGAALYAKGKKGKLDDPTAAEDMNEYVKICEVVIKRDPVTNEIKNAFLNWENNYVADDILNYAGHKELGDRQTFTTRMVQRVDLCKPHNITEYVDLANNNWYDNREKAHPDGSEYFTRPGTNGLTKPAQGENRWARGNNVMYHAYVQRYDHSFYLKKSHFYVKFLRPINLGKIEGTFVDARLNTQNTNQGDRLYLDDFKNKLTDWRGNSFYAGDYKDNIKNDGRDYFRYYGALDGVNALNNTPDYGSNPLNKMTGDMLPEHFEVFTQSSYITTDMHNGTLNENSLWDPNIQETFLDELISSNETHPQLFHYVKPTVLGDPADPHPFGYIYYDNNRVTVGKFKVKIPVRLQYRWGYIWSYIIATVDTTQDN